MKIPTQTNDEDTKVEEKNDDPIFKDKTSKGSLNK